MTPARVSYLWAGLFGGLTALCVYPLNWWWLFPVSVLGFLWTLERARDVSGFWLGLAYGTALFFGSLNWIFHVLPPGLTLALGPVIGLFYAGFAVVASQTRSAFLIATIWTGFEYLRSEVWLLKFPWSTPGVALGPCLVSPWLGVYGISFLTVLACALVLKEKFSVRAGGAVLLLSLIGFKLGNELTEPEMAGDPVSIALVQLEDGVVSELKELSDSVDGEPDITVWPEYALMHDPTQDREDSAWLAGKTGLLVAGYMSYDPKREVSENTAIVVSEGEIVGRHVKNHTVHFFDEGQAGTEAKAIETRLGKLGTPICFDGDYQDVYRAMALDGAQLFLAPTMDAISWSKRQHLQHAELTRHRAAENGRWVAVAATSGRTQIIDPKGRRVADLPLIEPGVLEGEVGLLSEVTFFSRSGWLMGPLCLLGTICCVVWLGVRRLKGRPPGSNKD